MAVMEPESMPPLRRTLFRGTWQIGGNNVNYAEDNRAL